MTEDHFTNRNSGYRVLIKKVTDTGTEQYVDVHGRDGEQFTDVLRIQPHGFSSSPPANAHAIAVPLGGNCDLLVLLGGEDPSTRQKNLSAGDTIIYNATTGTTIHLQGDKIAINSLGDIAITATGNIVLTAPNIALDGQVYLGGPVGSGVPASMKGTEDTGGNLDVSHLATKVNAT